MSGGEEDTGGTVVPPTFEEVLAAARRLHGVARTTPLLSHERLDERAGGRLLIKPEPLQHTGSFKFRGAYNALCGHRPAAVVAYSSGNHAQGVARAARLLGVPACIVMPADAPAIKRAATEAWGAEVVTYDRRREVREEIGTRIAAERRATLIRPYDDPFVIAGQGTVGLEIVRQCLARGVRPELALFPCGGGGLVSGGALALTTCFPGIAVHCVEPEGFDDTARSLRAGTRVSNPPEGDSFCDALLAPIPGELTFAVNRRLLAGGLAVSDAEVADAMRLAFETLKIVTEPGGAVALAAALSRRIDLRGRTAVVVLSGGNVDPELFAAVLAGRVPARR